MTDETFSVRVARIAEQFPDGDIARLRHENAALREQVARLEDAHATSGAIVNAANDVLRAVQQELDELTAENAALREIAEAVAKFPLWWHHMRPLYFECPACREEVPVGVDASDRPSKATMDDAEAHFVHDPDCPVLKARAILAPK